ncbi:hypothetical protein BJF92_14870 [Rhizobium rhizosphaerae]|uniref:Toxin CcdB n=1 Tax=Xaviernesmea rhizosphaerae TaxID=1672749 RepID=A0A1Q9ACR5_9HYPH|nr:CcdB family protein [Xaviernesmea rhizosphaerae]OLP52688.1 hypothetical protein BJF92_14870 [Xaviernesmea rhizosphaerae]
MARFDVYQMKADGALVVDVQSSLLDGLDTRVVVPLLPLGALAYPIARLNPMITVDGTSYLMATQFIGTVPERAVSATIANLKQRGDDITAALDFLFQGF